jgi:hypothetical protein
MTGMGFGRRIVLIVELAHIIASDLLPAICCYMIDCSHKVFAVSMRK